MRAQYDGASWGEIAFWGLALLLILALLPAVASAQSLDDAVTGGQSAVASRYQWGSTGGDWPVPASAPAPVVDCRGDFRSGACGATTFTPSGSPGLASTYWRPGGGSVAGSGVAFDGSDDLMEAPSASILDAPTKLLVLVKMVGASTSGAVIAKDFGSAGTALRGWNVRTSGTALSLYVYKDDATYSTISAANSTAVGAQTVAAFYYKFVADGTSIGLANINGTAVATSNLVGPIQSTATPVRIGAARAGALWYTGEASGIRVYDLSASEWEPSAAQLAAMVRSQYAAQGSMGEPLTVTRASSKSCSIGGAWFTVPSNTPCIGDAGLSVEGSRTQYALNNCTAPADQSVTLAAGAHTLWLEGAGTVAAAVGTATATGLPCAASAASACSFTVTVGGTVTLDATGTVDRMQVENGARSSLICATTTPVTRAADSPAATHGIADGGRWSVSFDAEPGRAWRLGQVQYLGALGAATGANRAAFFIDASNNAVIYVADAENAYKSAYVLIPNDSARRTLTFSDDGGTLGVSFNGVRQVVTIGGSGTGVIGAWTNTLSIGATGAGTYQFDGAIRSVTTCNTSAPQECQ